MRGVEEEEKEGEEKKRRTKRGGGGGGGGGWVVVEKGKEGDPIGSPKERREIECGLGLIGDG